METEFWWRQGPMMINVEAASATKYSSAKYIAVILFGDFLFGLDNSKGNLVRL